MKKIKLWFTDFHSGFEPQNNYFFKILSEEYLIEIDPSNPDYLIYSCYGSRFLNYDCVRIYYTGENLIPDFNLCDYAIGFSFLNFGDRYLRYPNFALYNGQFQKLIDSTEKNSKIEKIKKENFCNFIYSNPKADPKRDQFFFLLSEYKKILSPGSHLHNINLPVGERESNDWMFSKIDFQSTCKFTIAFENSSSPGYTTEKLMHAFISNTIPIYWGNPEVTRDFNSKAFINVHEFKNAKEVVARVIEIDKNDQLFLSIMREPAFPNNTVPYHLDPKRLVEFFRNIIDQDKFLVRKRPSYGTTIKYETSLKKNVQFDSQKHGNILTRLKQKLTKL